MNTIRTKICGITRPEDALAAAELGADAIGLVFYAKSKRAVSIEQAQAVVKNLPPFVSVVALFVNEDDDFCRRFDRPYLKAVRVQSSADIQTACAKFPNARALLFDAYHPTEYGGTGQSFDWTMLHGNIGKPWILAGGLTAENVAEAVKISGAAAVDVSGGVEISGGIKSREKMAAFIQAVKAV